MKNDIRSLTFLGKARVVYEVDVDLAEIYEKWFDRDDFDDYEKFCCWVEEYYGEEADLYVEITDIIELECDWDQFPITPEEFAQAAEDHQIPLQVHGQLDVFGNMVDRRGKVIS